MLRDRNREAWLNEVARNVLEPIFAANNAEMPTYRVTCGFPATGGLARTKRTIGQCWGSDASGDGTHEIIISMTQDEPIEVAAILAHEMVHASVGIEAGHKKPFKDLAVAIGLTGKMTNTTASDEFKQAVQPQIDALGIYPHAKIDATKRKKQTTRLIKCECSTCGYTVRTTNKWINEAGAPRCAVCYDDTGSYAQMAICN